MKILWVTNVPLPEASLLLNENPNFFGGWLYNSSKHLSEQENYELSIAFPDKKKRSNCVLKGEKIKYYMFPPIYGNKGDIASNVESLKSIMHEAKPDLVHIFGTEFKHTLAMVDICNTQGVKTVISIQGLVSVISLHYTSGIPDRIYKRFTFRDLLKRDSILQQQKKFGKRGLDEITAIKRVDHIIGRTNWDKANALQINPGIKYHHCDESLREEFYNHQWDINKCERYTLFISQGQYPIKGLHFIIEAIALIKEQYPEVKLYVGGINITKNNSVTDKIKLASYGKYLNQLIIENEIMDNIIFTGPLDEKQMKKQYLKSHIFVCPSSIENSPNSLGEAMMLGVPCVASYVGGIPDMLKDKEEGFLYQHDAPYMLAHYICEIFENDSLALQFSQNARVHALKTHDKEGNTKRLLDIYNEIVNK